MSKMIAALVACSALSMPLQGLAAPAYATASMASLASTQAATSAATSPSASPADPTQIQAKTLDPIEVTVPKPHIWTYRKGNSTVLVLGTVYPEPRGLTFVPGSIRHAIAQSGAVIGPPWFHFDADVGLFSVLSVWHAASGAKYLPDGKQLSDVLSPTDLQQWNALKKTYLPSGDKIDHMRPMYAGWKLYDAVLDHSGVAVDPSVQDLIKSDADKQGIQVIDAQFHWSIKDPKAAAHAFEPSEQADLRCFESILTGIQGVPESARTLAAAWAIGDVATMKDYVGTHTLTRPCWAGVTQEAVAQQQGLNRDLEERKAWLAAFDAATAKYPIVFTTAPVQYIFKSEQQIAWMLQEGYVEARPDAAPTSSTASTTLNELPDAAPTQRAR